MRCITPRLASSATLCASSATTMLCSLSVSYPSPDHLFRPHRLRVPSSRDRSTYWADDHRLSSWICGMRLVFQHVSASSPLSTKRGVDFHTKVWFMITIVRRPEASTVACIKRLGDWWGMGRQPRASAATVPSAELLRVSVVPIFRMSLLRRKEIRQEGTNGQFGVDATRRKCYLTRFSIYIYT